MGETLGGTTMGLSTKEKDARKMVCLPLDGLTPQQAEERIKELSKYVGMFKINSLFTTMGPAAIEMIHNHEADVFLDLKFHDIPNTVENYAYEATKHGVKLFNVHAGGGLEMMVAAKKGAEKAAEEFGIRKPEIYAVTVLTSLDDVRWMHNNAPLIYQCIDFEEFYPVAKLQAEQKKGKKLSYEEQNLLCAWKHITQPEQIESTIIECPGPDIVGDICNADVPYEGEIVKYQVLHYAKLAEKAGLDGIVCSAAELEFVKPEMTPEFKYITPGIESPATGQVGADQLRTLTPSKAVKAGSDILVVGRAITGYKTAEVRRAAAYAVLLDIASVL